MKANSRSVAVCFVVVISSVMAWVMGAHKALLACMLAVLCFWTDKTAVAHWLVPPIPMCQVDGLVSGGFRVMHGR